jgi:hypothetical protein
MQTGIQTMQIAPRIKQYEGMKDLKLVQINLFTTNAYTTLKLNHLGN